MLRCADFPFFRPFIFQNFPPFINKSRRLGDLSPSSLPPQKKCAMIAQYLLHLYNGNIESNGIQPRYFGVVYTAPQIQRAASYGIQPCYFWVVYTRHRYSVPQSAGRRLSRDYQQTEYSCFHDDHASPQALIPVIPSVLNFFRAPAASGHR